MAAALLTSIPIRAFKMSREDVVAVLNALDEPGPTPTSGVISQRRANDRASCRRHAIVVKGPSHGAPQHYAVHLRNISNDGAAFLHTGMLHRDTACMLLVLQLDGTLLKASGRVARCRHVSGMVYEVGLRFEHPIDASKLLTDQSAAGDRPTTNT